MREIVKGPASEVCINLGGQCQFSGVTGLVELADGKCLRPLAHEATCREDQSETNCGAVHRMHLAGSEGGITVNMVFALYRAKPILEIEMLLRNDADHDILLERIVPLRGLPPQAGFSPALLDPRTCRFLAQPHHWPGHLDVRNYLSEISPQGTCRAHWSTVIGTSGQPALAIGIGEAARGTAEVTFSSSEGRVGLEISSTLRTDREYERHLRLPPGTTYASHRMVLVLGADPASALDQYTEFVCERLNWKLRFPPYAGLFSGYGSDPENKDPQRCSLSEKRMAELMQVVEKYLHPYGLETIKTQFHGVSSSRPDGKPVRKLSAQEARDPTAVKKLVDSIKERAFAPDDYDSRQDYPHGLGWHVQQLSRQGYRTALVCRPFYNIEAGTPELDRAAADLFEMAVKDWGYRYLMLDFISVDYESDNDTLTVEQGITSRFRALRERLGPDIFIEACMVWPGPVLGLADGYRPAHDWRGGLEEDLAPTFACRYHYHGHFFQCDSEFFDPALRPFTWNKQGREDMLSTLERVRLWVSYNAMLGYSFLGGAGLERVEPERWHVFQRALPVQTGRAQPVDFFENSPPRRWLRTCRTPSGEHTLIGQFNWDKTQSVEAPLEPQEWGLAKDAEFLFFDFWAGTVHGPARRLPGLLAPFSCRMLQVQPIPTQPALVGNTRHVTGQAGIERFNWAPETNTLEGTFSGAPGSQEQYWIWLPGNEGVEACTGAAFEIIRPHLVRLALTFDKTGRQAWRLSLSKKIPVP